MNLEKISWHCGDTKQENNQSAPSAAAAEDATPKSVDDLLDSLISTPIWSREEDSLLLRKLWPKRTDFYEGLCFVCFPTKAVVVLTHTYILRRRSAFPLLYYCDVLIPTPTVRINKENYLWLWKHETFWSSSNFNVRVSGECLLLRSAARAHFFLPSFPASHAATPPSSYQIAKKCGRHSLPCILSMNRGPVGWTLG